MSTMTDFEIEKVQSHLRRTFANPTILLKKRLKQKDSAEVYIGDEFIGVVYRDDEDGELSFMFEMAILDEDLG